MKFPAGGKKKRKLVSRKVARCNVCHKHKAEATKYARNGSIPPGNGGSKAHSIRGMLQYLQARLRS